MQKNDLEQIKNNKYLEVTRRITNKIKDNFPTTKESIKHDLQRIGYFNNMLSKRVPYMPDTTHHELFKQEDSGLKTYTHIITELNQKHNLQINQKSVTDELFEYSPMILAVKQSLNRLRPLQASRILGIPIQHVNSCSANTPSLPSGHTIQGLLFGAMLYRKHKTFFAQHPDTLRWLIEFCNDIGMRRIMAGLHFPSDHLAGAMFVLEITKSWDIPEYDRLVRKIQSALTQ
jgi:hypothetical protein